MEGIAELNRYFDTVEKGKNDANEIIAELQQAITVMSRAIEQIALTQIKEEPIVEDKMDDVEEVKDEKVEVEEDNIEEKEL